MKVVLFALNSSYIHTNLAVRALAKPLYEAGTDVVIVEKNLKDRRTEVLEELYRLKADAYGFSVYIWNRTEMLSYASDLKKILPESEIIFGGPEVSFETEAFIYKNKFIDFIIQGEGEVLFKELICGGFQNSPRILQSKGRYDILSSENDFCSSAGILYDLPVPGAAPGANSLLYYESSRGCPFRCAYCLSSLTHGVKAKNAETVLSELRQFEKYSFASDVPDIKCGADNMKPAKKPRGERILKFVDRTFNFDPARANIIWRGLLSKDYTLRYHFEVCAELLNEESFEILSKMPAGKLQLEIGIQSTNPQTLAAIDRRDRTETILKAIERIASFGNIHVHADLIAGLPYEDIDSFRRSFDEVCGSAHQLQLGFLKLLPGLAIRDNSAKYGYEYTEAPPYEILKNDFLSFDDIIRLKRIDEVLERFGSCRSSRFGQKAISHGGTACGVTPFDDENNSVQPPFALSLSFIMDIVRSPFDFYDGLADFIQMQLSSASDFKSAKCVSQRKAYELFFEYGKKYIKEAFSGAKAASDDFEAEFKTLLQKDFMHSETGRLPFGIR